MPTVTKTSGFFSARGKHSLHKLRDTSGGGQTIEESQVPTAQTRHQDARQPGRDRVIATSRVGCARSKTGVSTARLERGSYGDHHHHHHRNHHHRHCLRHGGGDNPANRQTSRIVRGRTRPRGGICLGGELCDRNAASLLHQRRYPVSREGRARIQDGDGCTFHQPVSCLDAEQGRRQSKDGCTSHQPVTSLGEERWSPADRAWMSAFVRSWARAAELP